VIEFTIAFPSWLPLLYLGIGALLLLPLEYRTYRRTTGKHDPFPVELWRGVKRRPWAPFVVIILWPLALYEAFR